MFHTNTHTHNEHNGQVKGSELMEVWAPQMIETNAQKKNIYINYKCADEHRKSRISGEGQSEAYKLRE